MKNNLAKVLGLEEYNEEPNIRVEPTEDEIIQIEQDNFVQDMADHSEATTEALEAIGNAHQLAGVIARNDSTDKTTYELLKVAVEQLKEKTGVYTQSVSLESLDKGSYKTEALQDVKNFIVTVWEAIKKAFFSMWDKIKVFFKGLFNKTNDLKKEAEDLSKEAKDMEKDSKYTEDNENSPYGKVDENYTIYSKQVYKSIGIPKDYGFSKLRISELVLEQFNQTRKFYEKLGDLTMRMWAAAGHIDSKNMIKIPYADVGDKKLFKGTFDIGVYAYDIRVSDGSILADFPEDSDISSIAPFAVPEPSDLVWLINAAKNEIDNLLRFENGAEVWYKNAKDDIDRREKELLNKSREFFENNQEDIAKLKENFNSVLNFNKTAIAATVKILLFKQSIVNACLKYARQSMDYVGDRAINDKNNKKNRDSLTQAEKSASKINF